jgi:biotin carboxyl carrier protein
MKIIVNGTLYNLERVGEKVYVNNKEVMAKLNEDNIIIDGNIFQLDFVEEGDPSLVILNGMAYTRSKSFLRDESTNEVKIPISGMITELFVKTGTEVKQGVVLAILQAMKMEIEIKSPRNGKIMEIKASRDESVKVGDVLVTFE